MRILVDVTEAAERLEELIELSLRGDEIVVCRDERSIAMLTPIARKITRNEDFLSLAAEGRKSVSPGTTSVHSDFTTNTACPNERG